MAVGIFLATVSWFGWDGGLVGARLDDVLRILVGRTTSLLPAALVAIGGLMLARHEVVDLRPFRTGLIVLAASLTLVFGAGSFGVGPDGDVPKTLDPDVIVDYGGLVGGGLAAVLRTLIGDIGTAIVAALGLTVAVLLITGASIGAHMRRSARVGARAARRTAGAARRGVDALALPPRPKGAAFGRRASVPSTGPATERRGVEIPAAASAEVGHGHEPAFDGLSSEADGTPLAEASAEALPADLGPPDPGGIGDEDTGELAHEPPATGTYVPPDRSVLRRSKPRRGSSPRGQDALSGTLVETLQNFGIEARVSGHVSGPRVTRYELQLAPGIKVSRVANLKDDLAYALATTEIRILAPIPGKQAIGVEVPNASSNVVTLGDIAEEMSGKPSPLSVWLGKDISGVTVTADLSRMPHLLIAGTTGSGKSGCINTMLCSILLRTSPDDVRMILVDPKRVELGPYDSIPHLMTPVVSSPRRAAAALLNVVEEMERRYGRMSVARARNLPELNRALEKRGEPRIPYLLVVIDELADLMMISPQDVEDAIIRLAQKSRAVGIHLVLATQRPSVDVITGLIKANVPSRIAFAVSSQTDSRVILDSPGAESLLGQGDMLFKPLGTSRLQRVQGAYVTEEEVALIVARCRQQRAQDLDESLLETPEAQPDSGDEDSSRLDPDDDPLLGTAIDLVVQTQSASVSLIQRRLRVGYTRAGRLVDMLERRNIISGYEGSKPRRVLVTSDQLERADEPVTSA
ncbi:MAG: DNA translocase FtsK 4TM domain-containing protein [Gaiellales bacterium]